MYIVENSAVKKYHNSGYVLPKSEGRECSGLDEQLICDQYLNTRGVYNCPHGRDEKYCDFSVGKLTVFTLSYLIFRLYVLYITLKCQKTLHGPH